MRPLFLCTLCLWWAGVPLHAQNVAPVVSNVHAEQRPDTTLVDITYDVADADGDSLIIVVTISGDNGRTFRVNSTTFMGDIGPGVRPGGLSPRGAQRPIVCAPKAPSAPNTRAASDPGFGARQEAA